MRFDTHILWLTKDCRLINQAADDLLRQSPVPMVRRLGGGNGCLKMPEVEPDDVISGVVYATILTAYNFLKKGHHFSAGLIVWDECHWAQQSKMGRKILKYCNKKEIRILGLTATPRDNDLFKIGYQRSYFDLVAAGWLAKPIVEMPVETGINWIPKINDSGDFDANSLRVLGADQRRNIMIAEYYSQNAGKYGQTIIFACNIGHANQLVKTFSALGVAIAPVHSAIPEELKNQYLQDFKNKSIRVLVNVEMLIHGIDLPFLKTIFLCRPTTSEILFAQMIGRGSRKSESKDDFYIVEFTDNIKNHKDLIVTPKQYFSGAGSNKSNNRNRLHSSTRKQKHEFDSYGLPTWIPDNPSLPSSIHGLWYRRDQTFGIEFELTHPDMPELDPSDSSWSIIASELLNAIRNATEFVAKLPIPGYAGALSDYPKDCSVWNVEYDSTVGWEITSPILSNLDGYLEVARVCEALCEPIHSLGLTVNYKTGTHIHLGWTRELEELRRLVRLCRLAEPALGTLVAPSRLIYFDGIKYHLNQPNEYCEPISFYIPESGIESWNTLEDVEDTLDDRYATLNLLALFDYGTVEVRMHSGTIEARKILLWLSLWQQILWAASIERDIPTTEDRKVIIPNGDIIEFARTYLPDGNEPSQASFLHSLDLRRSEIVDIWQRTPNLRKWVKFTHKWK